ncbi:MAG: hypothetical protein RJB57_477, partial [Actinomycetota bacterium]
PRRRPARRWSMTEPRGRQERTRGEARGAGSCRHCPCEIALEHLQTVGQCHVPEPSVQAEGRPVRRFRVHHRHRTPRSAHPGVGHSEQRGCASVPPVRCIDGEPLHVSRRGGAAREHEADRLAALLRQPQGTVRGGMPGIPEHGWVHVPAAGEGTPVHCQHRVPSSSGHRADASRAGSARRCGRNVPEVGRQKVELLHAREPERTQPRSDPRANRTRAYCCVPHGPDVSNPARNHGVRGQGVGLVMGPGERETRDRPGVGVLQRAHCRRERAVPQGPDAGCPSRARCAG